MNGKTGGDRIDRRTFLARAGGAIAVLTAGRAFANSRSHASGTTQGLPLVRPAAMNWQLPEGHYERHLELHPIYPRPDAETNSYARHRHAYPGRSYEIYIGVQFGAWPYRFEKIAGPDWLEIADETLQWDGTRFTIPQGYGVLRGIAPATPQAPETVTVRVYDQAHNRPNPSYADITFSVQVHREPFVFVDNANGNDATADGSIESPYRTVQALKAFQAHGRKICIVLGDAYYIDWPSYGTEERFDTLLAHHPAAYIRDMPGYCHVNGADANRFANERGEDSFYAGFSIEDIQQNTRLQDNVKVFQNWGVPAVRTAIQRVQIKNMWPGHKVNDNPGAIVCMVPSGYNLDNPASLHRYNHYVDIVVDRLWREGDTRAGNPPAAYVSGGLRNLIERFTVKNAGYGGHIFNKWGSRYHEVRACTLTENNPRNAHVQIGASASSSYGVTKHAIACWNRANPGNVWFSGVSDDPGLEGFVALRNSVPDVSSHTAARKPLLRGNIATAYTRNDHWNDEGRNILAASLSEVFDAEMRLAEKWIRDNPELFGRFGADIA